MPDVDLHQDGQIEPIVPAKPIIFKTEKQLAAYLTESNGEAPIGSDLSDVFSVATDPYLTRAEQEAAIHAEILAQQPEPPTEYTPDAVGAWRRRGHDQNVVRVPKVFKNGKSSLDSLSPYPRPGWADPRNDVLGPYIQRSQFRSYALIATALSSEVGLRLEDGTWFPSYLQAHISRDLDGAQPLLRLNRYGVVHEGGSKNHPVRIEDWEISMTAAEVTQLAHTLLAAVDLMTEAEVAQ
ncbi:hypothetical protein CH298_02760 [Rhodococcoides fascians]|uniref:hypothetical protein n=1 Tax=Rhodococcoides fascians TaxID=1828 RepID=UPI000B9C6996|nr:hypothetical protein [Rhodococcus fascians]OZE92473.1 hypothetical protein CH303_02760 [Rhodococcus fascians]OZF23106.1 hypothetical protein CH298_02760 [Rhodococcus fascians]OZF24820.1 hypothetical protein CH297_02760 [Rhodococcus fascians]OZF72415.1 hypothetical protein CH308_02765 [Rhodococcus fascians]OZF73713.1 hypothetical protein CH307_02760 [Rhodococcus fascians]